MDWTELLLAAGLGTATQVCGDEVVAFGDAPNDVELLAWAGRGVAVANAAEVTRAAADEVTASNEDDGVAKVLEQLVGHLSRDG